MPAPMSLRRRLLYVLAAVKIAVVALALLCLQTADQPHERIAAAFLLLVVVLAGILGGRAILRSLRAQEELEQKLKASMELLRASLSEQRDLYDRAPCGYHTVDPDGLIIRMNETELAWLGYANDEVVGRKRIMDLVPPDEMHAFYDGFASFIVNGRQAHDIQGNLLRRNGTRFPVLISASAVRDAGGRLLQIRAAVMDRTDAARTQEELLTTVQELEKAMLSIRTLTGLLPICSSCKKIRDDTGYWQRVETYLSQHTEAQFSHGVCPDCFPKMFPDLPYEQEEATPSR